MRTLPDFAPLQRSSIGFDRIFALLENASHAPTDSWPPFDITKAGEDAYRITMAVAGFSQSELELTMQPNLLVVAGKRVANEDVEYLHRGIANRAFTQRFELADHVHVTHAQLTDGLLSIELKREIPEEMKPHRISITGSSGEKTKRLDEEKVQQVDDKKAA